MAGGIGSRFWPISREARPKQFLDFTKVGMSFLRITYDRMKEIIPEKNIIVVSLTRYKDLVRQQLPELPEENLLLETYNRNTAPCITYATYSILARDPLAVTVVTPADLVVKNLDIFYRTMISAMLYAAGTDALITLGVVPTRPDSNFGYIQIAGAVEDGHPVKVKTFTEKPDEDLAQVFIDSGEFLWNSGMFVWRASAIRDELEYYAPEITRLWRGWKNVLGTDAERSFVEKIYSDCPRISIDYAVMEKTDNAWVYPAKFSWADIGNWESLYEYLAYHDSDGNATRVDGNMLLRDSSDNVIYSNHQHRLTAIRGLEGYIIVDTPDVLMVCPRDDAKLKDFLSELALPDYEDYR